MAVPDYRICGSCGAKVTPDAKSCGGCGTEFAPMDDIRQQAAAAQAQLRARSRPPSEAEETAADRARLQREVQT